ncbi:unknown similar to AMEV245 [Mythimna separata entomopoxvirus 'L']|uniref:Uncharacterized protein n=1 Tax=Mythimna separata entomopoxvirus 'L' TaxID=1293572 RepID=A0A916KQI7_9POXV|nr:unknown similar to AMEV245 [Mythimna separata entomopoxvirus 'L']CCU56465.1 unknown similar to AMEV245 [Mythimna separata entomopoxvirus 'L']
MVIIIKMDIHECMNLLYDKLKEYIDSFISNIKYELLEYIDKILFNKIEYIDELINNYKNETNKYINKIVNNTDIKNYPNYILGDPNIISSVNAYIPKNINERYKLDNNIYIPYKEILYLSNMIDIHNEYFDNKIKNIYKENIKNIILLDDPIPYIDILKSLIKSLNIDDTIELCYDIKNISFK